MPRFGLLVLLVACNGTPGMGATPYVAPTVPSPPPAGLPGVTAPAPLVAPTPATPLPGPAPAPSPLPSPAGAVPAAPRAAGHWPAPEWLCRGAVRAVKRNHGGSSITFKLTIEGGGRAAFKPDQEAGFSRYRAELAAYRLSELLGYGRVPPSCERTLGAQSMMAAAGTDDPFRARLGRELRVGSGGGVRGAAILWVDGIRPLDLFPGEVPRHPLVQRLSDMILFDELTANWDRWSGGNVFTDASGGDLVLIDNAAAFGPVGAERRARMDAVLDRAVSPSPAFMDAMVALTREGVTLALAEVGYGEAQVNGVMDRRDRLLARLVRQTQERGRAPTPSSGSAARR
jgi:hypothetical protein